MTTKHNTAHQWQYRGNGSGNKLRQPTMAWAPTMTLKKNQKRKETALKKMDIFFRGFYFFSSFAVPFPFKSNFSVVVVIIAALSFHSRPPPLSLLLSHVLRAEIVKWNFKCILLHTVCIMAQNGRRRCTLFSRLFLLFSFFLSRSELGRCFFDMLGCLQSVAFGGFSSLSFSVPREYFFVFCCSKLYKFACFCYVFSFLFASRWWRMQAAAIVVITVVVVIVVELLPLHTLLLW